MYNISANLLQLWLTRCINDPKAEGRATSEATPATAAPRAGHVRGYPVMMIVEPKINLGHIEVSKTGKMPAQRWADKGKLQYIDQRKSRVAAVGLLRL